MPRDFGTQGRAVLRVAGRKTGENRWVRPFTAAAASPSQHGRVLHVLWLEVTGLLFLVSGLVGGGAAVREYHAIMAGTTHVGKVCLAAAIRPAVCLFRGEFLLEIAEEVVSSFEFRVSSFKTSVASVRCEAFPVG